METFLSSDRFPDCTYIETVNGESRDQWQKAVEKLLTRLWGEPKPNWWPPFTAGPTVEWAGRRFRSFRCLAGSVTCHLMVKASKHELARGLIVVGTRYSDGLKLGEAWCDGRHFTFGAAAITPIEDTEVQGTTPTCDPRSRAESSAGRCEWLGSSPFERA